MNKTSKGTSYSRNGKSHSLRRHNNRAMIFAACSAAAALVMFSMGPSTAQNSSSTRPPSSVDFPTFQALSEDAAALREARLVTLEQFLEMGGLEDTIILDTRSKSAFDAGHIKGAVNLNFSDFTDDMLAEVISDFDTRILIYCNNNFEDDTSPVPKKMAPLALNIPTFINLYGYGYTNIYELGDEISMHELGENWVSSRSVHSLSIQKETEL